MLGEQSPCSSDQYYLSDTFFASLLHELSHLSPLYHTMAFRGSLYSWQDRNPSPSSLVMSQMWVAADLKPVPKARICEAIITANITQNLSKRANYHKCLCMPFHASYVASAALEGISSKEL